jgi:hypothetical protein
MQQEQVVEHSNNEMTALWLTDLTFMEENPTKIGDMINYEKLHMIMSVFRVLKKVQQHRYAYTENDVIKVYLEKATVMDEEELFAAAKKRNSSHSTRSSSFFFPS